MAAFNVRAGFLYVTNANGISATITGYTNAVPSVLVIPANINGLTVTAIGEGAFAVLPDLTSVTIPDTVTTIEEDAFNASGLTDVTIPYGVTNIDEGAFADCRSLTNAVIPESVTSVGAVAFSDTGLSSVMIPGSVTNFGEAAFAGNDSLTNVVVSPGITSLGPYGVIGGSEILPTVTIPATVTNLEEAAFSGCTDLTDVFFQGNAPLVDSSVFENIRQEDPSGMDIPYYVTTAYYLPGTTGWTAFSSNTFISSFGVDATIPTLLWNPTIQATNTNFGMQNGQYGFDITAATNLPIAIEACDDLSQSNWVVLKRLTLTNGLFHFTEPLQTNTPQRFYRIGFP